MSIYNYSGAIHIHTLYSDGTADINTISKAAKQNGLSWIIITDHNNFEVEEGIINGVYVIKGEEISLSHGNHYLALGINEYIAPSDNCQENILAVKSRGGFGFAAHPDESLQRNNPHRPLRWLDKNIIPDGIEIWNWFSQWADNYDNRNIFSIIYSYLFKEKLIKKPNSETLRWWDYLNNNSGSIVPAIGGIDAHALKVTKYFIPVTIFPYKFMFKTITNEILLKEPLKKDFNNAKTQILNAIKTGNNIIVNKSVSREVPEFYINNKYKTVTCAESIELDSETYLHFKSKNTSTIKIIKDGEEIHKIKSKELNFKLSQNGKYRVETEIKNRGFAYTNPIIVK